MRLRDAAWTALVLLTLFASSPCGAAETAGDSAATKTAELLARQSGFPGGVCVVVGRPDADLAVAISRQGRFVVHALYDRRVALDEARRSIRSAGACGRASADLLPSGRLPYAENLVNVVVADRYPVLASKGFAIGEVLRVLAPLGVAFFGDSGDSGDLPKAEPSWAAPLRRELAGAGVTNIEAIEEHGFWLKATKPWPEEIDQWTHFLHGPDGNPVADDRVVAPPKHYQWTAGPTWLRAHDTDSSISTVVTARGRIYYIVDEAPISLPGNHPLPDKWFLAARDAFNGVLLWKVPIRHWGWREWKQSWFLARPGDIPLDLEMRLVAAGENLYVTLGYRAPVSRLDGRTGRILQTYKGTEGTREILYRDGVLVLTVPSPKATALSKTAPSKTAPPSRVVALDAATGRRLWATEKSYRGTTTDYIRWKESGGGIEPPVLDPALAPATDGRVVALVDGGDIVGLDFHTGKELWRTTVSEEKGRELWLGALIAGDGVVLYADRTRLVGISAETGRILWTQPKAYLGHLWYEWKDVFVIDGLVWTWSAELGHGQFGRSRENWPVFVGGYDLHTGKMKKQVALGPIFKTYHHHRCYRNKATVRYILASRRGTEYVDLSSGRHTVDNWVRGTCHYGMLPANGLQYAPPTPCRCYILEKLNGFNALAPEIPAEYRSRKPADAVPLEKGPAYQTAGPAAGPNDWPTFRHDAARSGATPASVPKRLDVLWKVKLGSKLSAPVAVGGTVFAALVDEHQVVALDAKDGKTRWAFIAGGRVDSPPTYYQGTLLFGSADGSVYCVRASDGRLAWRFRAAPEDRRIGAFGQLESAWPVSGSILVLDGTAYFAAGRSSHLDGGIYLYALDASSGEVIHHARLEGPDYTAKNITTNYGLPQGALADILSGDDEFVYMRGYRFNHALAEQNVSSSQLYARGGFLDDTYFQRAYWSLGNPGNFARLIVYDAESVYLVRMFDRIRALDPKHYFTPGKGGYTLLAERRENLQKQWSIQVPVRVRAMVLAAGRLVAAGPPDVVDPNDPLGAFEGRKGGVLSVYDGPSGEKLFERRLETPPVFGGAAVCAGRLYMAGEDGTLSCFGGR